MSEYVPPRPADFEKKYDFIVSFIICLILFIIFFPAGVIAVIYFFFKDLSDNKEKAKVEAAQREWDARYAS